MSIINILTINKIDLRFLYNDKNKSKSKSMCPEKEQTKNTKGKKQKKIKLNVIMSDNEFWKLVISHKDELKCMKDKIEFLLNNYGTKERCNRFDVGNTIENILYDLFEKLGFTIEKFPNANRIDIKIKNYKKLSIKYSSTGKITLHNSNSSINKDTNMVETILLTPEFLYLLSKKEISKCGIILNDYIDNPGDSLKLKRSLLTQLKKRNYPFKYKININHDKINGYNKLCSDVFYKAFLKEYNENKCAK